MKRIINKIRLLFKSLNVIGNINELIVKMHELEKRIDNNYSRGINLHCNLEKRIDNNYDKLEEKIKEEGKLFDDLEYRVKVNESTHFKLEGRTKASLKEVSLIIDEIDKYYKYQINKNINLSSKGDK